ncbi:hypothetical protein [Streptomyces sp. NPDC001135]
MNQATAPGVNGVMARRRRRQRLAATVSDISGPGDVRDPPGVHAHGSHPSAAAAACAFGDVRACPAGHFTAASAAFRAAARSGICPVVWSDRGRGGGRR